MHPYQIAIIDQLYAAFRDHVQAIAYETDPKILDELHRDYLNRIDSIYSSAPSRKQ
jgi:hypothetical protein